MGDFRRFVWNAFEKFLIFANDKQEAMPPFNALKIKEVRRETAHAVSLLFDLPAKLSTAYRFVSGQYLTLKTSIDGKEVRRAYSICSSEKSGDLRVAIKAIQGGLFSNFACNELRAGEVLEVSPPEGNFLLKTSERDAKNYLAFVAGSGITPVFSMLKTTLETSQNSMFTLVYGNKTEEETLFKNELDLLAKKHPEQLNLNYVFSREKTVDAVHGRIDESLANAFVNKPEVSYDGVFLCGPEAMIEKVSKSLVEKGFPKEKIHFELFFSSAKKSEKNTAEGIAEVTVIVDDEATSFSMESKETLLAASLRQKIDAPYSCQGGVCSSCMAKVTEGHARMSSNSILTDEEIEEGFVLTCKAHPTTEKITIDFDDV